MMTKLGNITQSILLGAACALCCVSADAKPAYPYPMHFTQPDGTEITVRKVGDERGHVFLTDDNVILEQRDGAFYYADVDASGRLTSGSLLARPAAKRSAADNAYLATIDTDQALKRLESSRADSRLARKSPTRAPRFNAPANGPAYPMLPGLFPDASFPAYSTQKVLVVLVEYTNKSFTVDDPYDHFYRMLNQQGYSDYGGTGSAADYFKDNSLSQFTPEFDVYGPITLAHPMSYYGGNDWWGNDQHPEEMVIEACQQLDDSVDFSEYDRDGDGYIDNVYVFYAGQGEASYGSSDTVWPHSWEVSAATYTPYYFDGVRLDRYACSNEWESARPDGIGTFVHEFSHVMGLPDLYATSYSGAFTPGAYSAMDYGPYNNDGRTPPAYGAFERCALGWMSPTVLDGPDNITLRNVTTNVACMVKTTNRFEYFLFENRQQSGWDAYIPGHGMLVWHIDYDDSVWNSNKVNDSSSHQYVDIEEADNTQNEYSRDGDTFPGYNNVTSFTDDTHPSMKTWSGKRLELPITDITESAGVVKFSVAGGLPDVNPVEITSVDDITAVSATATWTADESARSYLVSCFTVTYRNDREIRSYVNGWNMNDVGDVTTAVIDGLEPLTEYHVAVYSTNGKDVSLESNVVAFTTGEPTFDLFVPVAEEATEIFSDGFTANWQHVEGATDYLVDVFTLEPSGEPKIEVCDFTGGVANLPDGWQSTSQQAYANASYSGEAIPALRIGSDQGSITTPTYDKDIVSISFWHRGSSADPANTLKIMAKVNGVYTQIAEVEIVNAKGGCTTVIDEIPEGTRAISIVYNKVVNKGSVAIDDIEVSYDRALVKTMTIEGEPTGYVTDHHIRGLEMLTEYYYTVTATDGELFTRPSNAVKVTTNDIIDSVQGITSDTAKARVTAKGTKVSVIAPAHQAVNVYDVSGRLLYSGRTDATGSLTVDMRARGTYIVKVATTATKIIM